MINKFSKRLSKVMLSKGYITDEEKDIYIYGSFMMISQMLLLIWTCILGGIFNCFFEAIIFYVTFQLIRKYAGGYHASTETKCEILSALSVLICIIAIKISNLYDFYNILFIFAIISTVIIFVLCPLDTAEKRLSNIEYKYFRRISWLILLVIISVVIISHMFSIDFLFVPCCIGLVLEAVLIVAGKIKYVIKK